MGQAHIQSSIDLSPYSTFGFAQTAAHFTDVFSDDELQAAVALAGKMNWPILALGGGSNLIFAGDFSGIVIRQRNQLIEYRDCGETEGKGSTVVTASAGVDWHHLVMDTVQRGIAGLENLSLIPGTVGAAPVQNIGAYGVELCDRFVSLRALHLPSGQWRTMHAADCEFAYRDSLFKRRQDEFIITEVSLKLGGRLAMDTHYQALADYLSRHHPDETPNPQLVSEAVCAIRRMKLPDPDVLPNAGSFFHNPIVTADHHARLLAAFPELVAYPQVDGQYKLAAGWLIERLGYKGYRRDGVGVHEQQALVLVKHQQTPADALLKLAERIQEHVKEVFGVSLIIEPRILR